MKMNEWRKKETDSPFNFCILTFGEKKRLQLGREFFDTVFINPVTLLFPYECVTVLTVRLL